MSNSDSWCTPDDLFDVLDKGGVYQGMEFEGFNFDIDLCATSENSKCYQYYTNYLNETHVQNDLDPDGPLSLQELSISCAFMNPPYSNPKPFIEKAWQDARYCKIVCLVKVDTSTKWFSVFYDYVLQKPRPGCQIIFFPKRIKFDPPEGYDQTKKYSGPAFGCCLVIMDRRTVEIEADNEEEALAFIENGCDVMDLNSYSKIIDNDFNVDAIELL
jgi:phage N-6-adenine-methyltransferase